MTDSRNTTNLRQYSAIGDFGIDQAREEFIWDGVADLETIEREYREKKAEYRAALRAGRAWDRDHGVASLRVRYHRLDRAADVAAGVLAKTRPTSVAGASALLDYVRTDLEEFKHFDDWHSGALANAVLALNTVVNVHSA